MLTAFGIQQGVGHEYFVQLTADDPRFGGLSACTAGEADSSAKVTADGIAAMACVDPTIRLPSLAGAVLGEDCDQTESANTFFRRKSDKLQEITIE
jgi:deoxyhypusine synthase